MKVCTKCNIFKKSTEFHKEKNNKNGLSSSCKSCRKEYIKANTEKIKQQKKEYRKANAEKINQQKRDYYKANADKINQKSKEYRKAKADKIKADKIKEEIKQQNKVKEVIIYLKELTPNFSYVQIEL